MNEQPTSFLPCDTQRADPLSLHQPSDYHFIRKIPDDARPPRLEDDTLSKHCRPIREVRIYRRLGCRAFVGSNGAESMCMVSRSKV